MTATQLTALANQTLKLLRIHSVTGAEAVLCDYFYAWAQQQPHTPVLRIANSLVIGTPDAQKPTIALVGHLDTVPWHPAMPVPAIEQQQDGESIICGRGAADMKGALAVMQALWQFSRSAAPEFSLLLLFYAGEEGDFANNQLQLLLEQVPFLSEIDLAICLEPTDNTLQLGCVGSLNAEVVFTGHAAHAARPWQGNNAIHQAAPLLLALQQLTPTSCLVGGLSFYEVVNCTSAHGGLGRNVIPDQFTLLLNARYAPSPDVAGGQQRMQTLLTELIGKTPWTIIDHAPACPVPLHNPLACHFQQLCGLAIRPKQAWTDVARLAQFGIDAVNFGPGSEKMAHQQNEAVALTALSTAYESLRQLFYTPL